MNLFCQEVFCFFFIMRIAFWLTSAFFRRRRGPLSATLPLFRHRSDSLSVCPAARSVYRDFLLSQNPFFPLFTPKRAKKVSIEKNRSAGILFLKKCGSDRKIFFYRYFSTSSPSANDEKMQFLYIPAALTPASPRPPCSPATVHRHAFPDFAANPKRFVFHKCGRCLAAVPISLYPHPHITVWLRIWMLHCLSHPANCLPFRNHPAGLPSASPFLPDCVLQLT